MKLLTIAGTVVLLAACDQLVAPPLCGCSPPALPVTIVEGFVRTVVNQPAMGARVIVETLAALSCDATAAGDAYTVLVSDANGLFRFPVARYSEKPWCLRLTAEAAQLSDGRPSAQQLVTIRATPSGASVRPDTTRVTLQLRP